MTLQVQVMPTRFDYMIITSEKSSLAPLDGAWFHSTTLPISPRVKTRMRQVEIRHNYFKTSHNSPAQAKFLNKADLESELLNILSSFCDVEFFFYFTDLTASVYGNSKSGGFR